MKIGLIGCGNMGGAMAVHLAGSAHAPVCFDPDPQCLARVATGGCRVAASQLEVASACNLIVLSLPRADIVRSVMEAITPHVAPGSVVIDTSTSEPGTTRDMNRVAKKNGFSFVDAPVSGGPAAAGTGTMTMLIGGDDDADRDRCVDDHRSNGIGKDMTSNDAEVVGTESTGCVDVVLLFGGENGRSQQAKHGGPAEQN